MSLHHHRMNDEMSQLRKLFAELAALYDIAYEKSGVEGHESLATGEIYYDTLRGTYRKLKVDLLSLQQQVLLELSVKTINDTMRSERFVPSGLMFDEFSDLRTFLGRFILRDYFTERVEVEKEAMRIMPEHPARLVIERALKQNIHAVAKEKCQLSDAVFT